MPRNFSGDIPTSIVISSFSSSVNYLWLCIDNLLILKSMANLKVVVFQISLFLCVHWGIPQWIMSSENISVCFKLYCLHNLLHIIRNVAAMKEFLVLWVVYFAIFDRSDFLIRWPDFLHGEFFSQSLPHLFLQVLLLLSFQLLIDYLLKKH